MADFTLIQPLFGGSDYPDLNIDYGHYQADQRLLQAGIPPYLKQSKIPDTYITKIKTQQLGNCWIYSSAAMFETFALSHGFAAASLISKPSRFSCAAARSQQRAATR